MPSFRADPPGPSANGGAPKVHGHAWSIPARSARKLLLSLSAISVVIVGLSYVSLVVGGAKFEVGGEGHRLLNVGAEANVPTWWTAMLLGIGGVGFLARAWGACKLSATKYSARTWAYLLMGSLMLALSLDELASIHELLVYPAEMLMDGGFTFSWLLLGIPLGLAVLVVAGFAARHLDKNQRRMVMIGLGVLLLGAVVFESIGSYLASIDMYGTRIGVITYHVEDLLEMLGASVLACAHLNVLDPAHT